MDSSGDGNWMTLFEINWLFEAKSLMSAAGGYNFYFGHFVAGFSIVWSKI